LFGQVYNDIMKPKDPFEFVELLAEGEMLSLQRNAMMEEMVARIKEISDLPRSLPLSSDERLNKLMDDFSKKFSGSFAGDLLAREGLLKILQEMTNCQAQKRKIDANGLANSREAFLAHFRGEERKNAKELLDLAKASYRLRDDDNIYLGRIQANLAQAEKEGVRRLGLGHSIAGEEIIKALRDPHYTPRYDMAPPERSQKVTPRQLVGHAAGSGIGSGPARVLRESSDLYLFKSGEVMVCDAVDPNMTFIVPLCSAIVERRGGMLIHGAIIAREYGIPCVTGVPEAVELIETGDILTVDGYLGVITINRINPGKKSKLSDSIRA
jgi:pyruvate,water dikinase